MNTPVMKFKKTRIVMNLLTTLFLALFIAYQIFLLTVSNQNNSGRLIGIVLFSLIAIAPLFLFSPFPFIGTILFVAGSLITFILKLFNAFAIFGNLNFGNPPTVLSAAVFIFSELGLLILVLFCLLIRHNMVLSANRKIAVISMSAVIALYIACFAMEYVLMTRYGVGIEFSLTYTLISRVFYCLGFVSIAVYFMLPAPVAEVPNDLMNQPTDNDDFLFSTSENNVESPLPTDYDNDFVL